MRRTISTTFVLTLSPWLLRNEVQFGNMRITERGGLISGWTWDGIGAGWTYTLASLFAVGGFWLVWRWVREDAAVDAPGGAKTADPVP